MILHIVLALGLFSITRVESQYGKGCNADQFQCNTEECIPQLYRCNQYPDCADGSDEEICPEVDSPMTCPEGEFSCQLGGCVAQSAVCNSENDCADGSDESNCEVISQNNIWKPFGENVTASHEYLDDHLAAFTNINLINSSWSLHSVVSEAWKYTKQTYGSFGPDPRLYFILHSNNNNTDCSIGTFRKKGNSSRNVIECGTFDFNSNGWTLDHSPVSPVNLERLLSSLGSIIWRGAKGKFNDADLEVSIGIMKDIVVYDIYLYLSLRSHKNIMYERNDNDIKINDNNLIQWKLSKLNDSNRDTFWFRDWYLPIYERFGGASVLNQFYNYVYKYWRKRSHGDYDYMNRGEFVHFWSGAAGVDLIPFAKSTFEWTNLTQEQLTSARSSYSNFDYLESKSTDELSALNPPGKWLQNRITQRTKELNLAFFDKNVAIYTECETEDEELKFYPISSLKLLSTAWKYTQEIYSKNPIFPFLYISIENGRINKCQSTTTKDDFNVLYCTKNNDANETYLPLNEIIIQFSLEALKFKFEMMDGSIRNFWPAQNVSKKTIIPILVYDIYSNLGYKEKADRWKEARLNETENFPLTETSWFSDWYLKIYENNQNETKTNNKSHSMILENFFERLHSSVLLKKNKNNNTGYASENELQLNMGEFVHFWSGSVGSSVKEVAMDTFGWTTEYENQLNQARKDYVNNTNDFLESNETFLENFYLNDIKNKSFKSSEMLVNVYQDVSRRNHVGVYFPNSSLPHQIDWTFYFISFTWRYLKRNYPNILEFRRTNNNPHLYVTFLPNPNKSKTCGFLSSLNMTTKVSKEKTISHLIQCSFIEESPKNGWSKQTLENMEILMGAFENMLMTKLNEKNNADTDTVSTSTSTSTYLATKSISYIVKVIIYDLYRKQKSLDGAEKWRRSWGENKISSLGNQDWLTDWYMPIYNSINSSYGIGGPKVLNRYISLLSVTNEYGAKIRENMVNLGEFVHVWSEAANKDLGDLARNVFGLSQNDENYKRARKDYPQFSYFCSKCNSWDLPKDKSDDAIEKTVVIVGVSLVAILLLLFMGFTLFYYNRKFRIMQHQITSLNKNEVDDFMKGTEGGTKRKNVYVNPLDPNAKIYCKPFNSSYEIKRERLLIDCNRELGKGEFGVVYMGVIKPETETETEDVKGINDNDVRVAVKTVKPGVEVNYFKAMILEIKIMAYLGHHENIVSLLATVTLDIQKLEVLAALEFCPKGDLLRYLTKSRESFVDLWDKKLVKCYFTNDTTPFVKLAPVSVPSSNCETSANSCVSTLNLLRWARDISNGLVFLGEKNVIHGDLAARNVLITEDGVAKLADFGLSRQLLNYENYIGKSNIPMPWRWMALESLTERNFSVHSDTWSFGVTLWEIFSLGKLPFEMRAWDHEFMNMLRGGGRLESPNYSNESIYNLMLDCWKNEPKERISSVRIRSSLDQIIESLECQDPSTSTSSEKCYFLPK